MATPSEPKMSAFEDHLLKQVKKLEKQLNEKKEHSEEMKQSEARMLMLNMTIPLIMVRLQDIADKKCDPIETAKELLVLIETAKKTPIK